MHRLRRSVSSLTALLTFEAAARRESFTRAAAELGVTQAAVSRRMKLLEAEVGRALFLRANRRVTLTEEGRALYTATAEAFDRLADVVAEIRSSPTSLTVAVSVAFGHFRLLPALSGFRQLAPEIDLRVVSSDHWTAPDDPSVDVAVRFGKPPFRGMKVSGSLGESIVPVCAPSLAKSLAGIDAARLASDTGTPLIECDTPEPSWLGWQEWFAAQTRSKRADRPTLRLSSYSDGIYAAMEGQGVALGWIGLIERPLKDGRLVALDLPILQPEERHWIVVPNRVEPSSQVQQFVAWLERTSGFVAQTGER